MVELMFGWFPAGTMTIARALFLVRNWRDILTELRLCAGSDYAAEAPAFHAPDRERLRGAYIEWPSAHAYRLVNEWVDSIRVGLSKHVPVRISKTPAASSGEEAVPLIFHLITDGKSYPIAVDYCDYMDRIYDEAASSCALYFKMQYRRGGYPETPYDAKILPGGYINGHAHAYKYLKAFRGEPGVKAYRTDVYGRFGLTFQREIRQKCFQLLSQQKYFRFEGSLVKVRYFRFLHECAEARICIDMPSNSDFCFRLTDYLALGCCVVGPKHRTRFPVELEDRKNIVYVERDLSDLVETCRYYLDHDSEREAIGANARLYFDRYLHRESLAAYYLNECFARAAGMAAAGAGSERR